MTPALGRAAPLRFLIGVLLCWTVGRMVMLSDWSGGQAHRVREGRRIARPARQGPFPVPRHPRPIDLQIGGGGARGPGHHPADLVSASRFPRIPAPVAGGIPKQGQDGGTDRAAAPPVGVDAPALVAPNAVSPARWSGSAWAFLRGGGRTQALAPVGQIGGGQAGARLLYRLDTHGRLAATARVARTMGGPRQAEAAVGIDWMPAARLPLHIMADRRIAIDRGGRDAWALGAAGGVYALALAAHWRLDGYGEAGVVGARRRDLYADGAVRVGRTIDLGGGASLAPGGGLWGAAQPGAQRLDLGPSAVLRLPVDGHAVSVALDWRHRLAGRARPGSGAALTVATDF